MRNLVSLELNEINFDFVERYVAMGKLPGFARALDRYALFETVAEDSYPLLEPWIQWPTVYTGKSYGEHGVFRLGDIVGTGHDQIWETLEARGVSVGAISPMNAENRCAHADFFVPDPWTVTPTTGDQHLQELSALVAEAVNANAHEGGGGGDVARRLLPHLFRYASVSSWAEYTRILWSAKKYKWAKASFLDRFLADVFLKLREKHGTRFASLFLNAGAHIQHHHMYESAVYDGEQVNPSWYSSAKDDGVDPLLFIYQVYDQVLRDVLALKDTRVLVTTGLSQMPNEKTKYQYRFTAHEASLRRLGVTGFDVVPRMSRDFLLEFPDAAGAAAAKARMAAIACAGKPLFTIEDRNTSLFCQIGYFGPREGLEQVETDGRTVDISDEVVLVSIENGIHRTIGFHLDTAIARGGPGSAPRARMPLADVFAKMAGAFAAATRESVVV